MVLVGLSPDEVQGAPARSRGHTLDEGEAGQLLALWTSTRGHWSARVGCSVCSWKGRESFFSAPPSGFPGAENSRAEGCVRPRSPHTWLLAASWEPHSAVFVGSGRLFLAGCSSCRGLGPSFLYRDGWPRQQCAFEVFSVCAECFHFTA